MTTPDVDYWDAEACDDPRYARRSWGLTAEDVAQRTIDQILGLINPSIPPHGVVLEIGCGPGRLLHRLAWHCPSTIFIGTDISPAMLELCRRLDGFTAENSNVVTHLSDDVAQFVRDSSVDLVYCVELFQHLDDDRVRSYIEQACDALMPGGTFIAQFVTRGEPGPHSFPRDGGVIAAMYDSDLWKTLSGEIAVHPDWIWVTAVKA